MAHQMKRRPISADGLPWFLHLMATTEHYGTFPHRPKGTLRFASEPCLPRAAKCPVPLHAHSAAEVDTLSNLTQEGIPPCNNRG